MKITEGYMPYLGHKTYYRIAGECSGNTKPVILLHGGPGSTHNGMELLDCIAEDGRALISYDQLGCGNSMVESNPSLWTLDTWMNELIALKEHLAIKECHMLGHSWGGMLLIAYLCDHQPKDVLSAVLDSTLPSSAMWEEEQRRYLTYFPQHMQDAIIQAEANQDYENPDYVKAVKAYMARHCYSKDENLPECLARHRIIGKESYICAWGHTEFAPSGTLKDFDYRAKLKDIKQPSLIISGTADECTPLVAKYMYDHIPNSQWELLHGRHVCMMDAHQEYVPLVKDWFNKND